jgi:hypothetical protein
MSTDSSWAIVTPSYHGDFERCRILCQSIDAFVAGDWHHYIIVESPDYSLFKALETSRRTVIEMESILPAWLHHLASPSLFKKRSLWFSFRTGFMIGWQVQQLVKMQMAFNVSGAGLLFCDSDVFFVRKFDVAGLHPNGKFRFYRTDNQFDREKAPNQSYVISAARRLGLGSNPFPCPSYVDNIVAWHRNTAQALCRYIEAISGQNWMVALGKRYIISEYSLYGLFVDRLLTDRSHLQETGKNLCKTVWRGNALSGAELSKFCDTLEPDQVAVGFQSFVGVNTDELRSQLQRAVDRYA